MIHQLGEGQITYLPIDMKYLKFKHKKFHVIEIP